MNPLSRAVASTLSDKLPACRGLPRLAARPAIGHHRKQRQAGSLSNIQASMALSPQATLATARGSGSSETGDRVASEDVLQRELNLPRITGLAGNEAERRAVGVAIGPAPVRVVQHVESLDAEL